MKNFPVTLKKSQVISSLIDGLLMYLANSKPMKLDDDLIPRKTIPWTRSQKRREQALIA